MSNQELVQLQETMDKTDLLQEENLGTKEVAKDEMSLSAPVDEIDEILEAIPDEKPAPEDYASAYIERHLAVAKGLIKQLGGNAVERVFLNVMAGEFSRKEYNPVTENERALAFHFNECVNLRAKIVFSQEFERLAQAYAKEEEDLKKIDQLTQDALTPEAKQMLAEAGDKVEIKVD